jgi:hypothetical protein
MIPRLVTHHDPVVEGVQLEVSILPPLLLLSDIVREEAAELNDRRRLRCGECGGVRRAAERGRHRVGIRTRRVANALHDMGAGVAGRS